MPYHCIIATQLRNSMCVFGCCVHLDMSNLCICVICLRVVKSAEEYTLTHTCTQIPVCVLHLCIVFVYYIRVCAYVCVCMYSHGLLAILWHFRSHMYTDQARTYKHTYLQLFNYIMLLYYISACMHQLKQHREYNTVNNSMRR